MIAGFVAGREVVVGLNVACGVGGILRSMGWPHNLLWGFLTQLWSGPITSYGAS